MLQVLWQAPGGSIPEWPGERRPTSLIIREVAKRHGITVEQMKSRCRAREYVRPRQEAMYELRQHTNLSYPAIARRLGLLDHTTVMHGERRHRDRLAERAKPQ